MNDGLTVGVTFYLHNEPRSIFANGGHQHAVFLARLLARCPGVKRVLALNGGPGEKPPPDMLYDGLGLDFVRFEQVDDEVDLLIECGAQIPAWQAEAVHKRGGKVVAFKFGNAFVLDSQKLCDGRGNQQCFNGARFDAVWTNPQHMRTNASYWEAIYRCPVLVVPHIWDRTFVDLVAAKLGLDFGYRPGRARKRIAIYEPNLEVVKTCLLPMIICDLTYREQPDLIDTVWVTNTDRLRGQLTFQAHHAMLDICRERAADGKHVATFEARYNLVQFQSQHADVCVSWQWENALNYAYYELLSGHYPLVHNSELLPAGIGYRYHDFDAHDGARALLVALRSHDERAEEYNAAADVFLRSVSSDCPANISEHADAIKSVTARALAA